MYTQCPGCLSLFGLSQHQLVLGRGRARCGSCHVEFDVLASLSDELPIAPNTMLTRHLAGEAPVLEVAAKASTTQHDLFTSALVEMPEIAIPAAVEAPAEAPAFAQKRERRVRADQHVRGWRWANALLLLALSAQMIYAARAFWIDSPQVRPWLDAGCERIGCQLPPRRDLSQIALVARDVRPHPTEAGALVISATMLNRAEFGQPFPTLEITLSNLDEERIAMRRLTPQDYMNDALILARGLPPGATATIDLEVLDPGKQAVAFEFKFL